MDGFHNDFFRARAMTRYNYSLWHSRVAGSCCTQYEVDALGYRACGNAGRNLAWLHGGALAAPRQPRHVPIKENKY
jgi:hypothetical protein